MGRTVVRLARNVSAKNDEGRWTVQASGRRRPGSLLFHLYTFFGSQSARFLTFLLHSSGCEAARVFSRFGTALALVLHNGHHGYPNRHAFNEGELSCPS